MVNSFTPITTLKYWCQKVIPLVYEDSLSYYELLSKVVAKLNEVIENANKQDETIGALIDSFNELKYYVEHYLDTTDFQEMVNNKLEEMAQDGTIATILGYSVVRYNMPHQGTFNGKIVARTRQEYDNSSNKTRALQNATVYSPSGDYSYETPKYIYYWETWSDNKNGKLVVFDTVRREVVHTVPISEDTHGGELVVKDDVLYSINWHSNRLYKFSLSNPAIPTLISNTSYTLTAKRLIGWYEEENCWLACNSGNTAKTIYKVSENFATQSVLYTVNNDPSIMEQDWCYDDVNKVIYKAETWSNIITAYNVLNGEQLTDYAIPNTIAYANTGELEYIFAKGEHIYWGGMHTLGVYNERDNAQYCEFSHFYTNSHAENSTRHILFGVAGSRAIQVNYEADERNLTYPEIGRNNVVFKYVEDAFNYGKENGTPVVINFQTDYPLSFHVGYDCRLEFNNHDCGAMFVDDAVNCVMVELRGALIGKPNYTKIELSGVTRYIKSRVYARYGARLTVTNINEYTTSSSCDVNFFLNFAEMIVLTKTVLTSVFAKHSKITGPCIMGDYVYGFSSFFEINMVDMSKGDNIFIDPTSNIKAGGSIGTTRRMSISSMLDKKLPKQFAIDIASGNAYNGAPIGVAQIYFGSVGEGASRVAVWVNNTYEKVNIGILHTSVDVWGGMFVAHRWNIYEIENEPIPTTLKGYVALVRIDD